MKLKVHEKWQWLAKDDGSFDEWWFHEHEPRHGAGDWTNDGRVGFAGDAFDLPDLPPAKSLHRRIGDDWVPVDEVAGHVTGVTADEDGETELERRAWDLFRSTAILDQYNDAQFAAPWKTFEGAANWIEYRDLRRKQKKEPTP